METTSKKMRSHLSDMAAAAESEPETLSLSPSPPPRVAFNLSSMVVKPPASSAGGSDLDVGFTADDRISPPPQRRLHSPLHRRRSPEGFGRRVLEPSLHRRRSLIGVRRNRSPLDFHLRSPRLRNDEVAKFPGLGPSLLFKEERISLGTCFFRQFARHKMF